MEAHGPLPRAGDVKRGELVCEQGYTAMCTLSSQFCREFNAALKNTVYFKISNIHFLKIAPQNEIFQYNSD